MNDQKVRKLETKASVSAAASILSLIGCFIWAVVSSEFSSKANNEKMKDPEYREMIVKRAEADRQKYLYLQEQRKAEEETKKLQKEQEKKESALNSISDIMRDIDKMDDYERIDAAYRVHDIIKNGKYDEQVKYRALACISCLKDASDERRTERKIEDIGAEIEAL